MNRSVESLRHIVVFFGRVQGVGFRQTTVELSRPYQLQGTVCNLPDGSVELILEGSPEDIENLLRDVRMHFAGFITSMTRRTEPAQGLLPPVRIIW
jgi:acylphosphatase